MTQHCQDDSFWGQNAELYYYLCRMKRAKYSTVEDGAMLTTASFMHFPLMMIVVLNHIYISGLKLGAGVDAFVVGSYTLSKIVGNMAVPCFFFISGYLFFRNVESLSVKLYCDKLRRRVRTLLQPYLLWNILILALYAIGQMAFLSLFSGANTKIADYSVAEWAQAFWCVEGTQSPINPPLWYIRDLMVMVVLSPILYCLMKNRVVGALFLCVMLALAMVDVVPLVWLQPRYILLFGLGAWGALHGLPQLRFRGWVALLAALACGAGVVGFFMTKGAVQYAIFQATILVGASLLLYTSRYLAVVRGWRVPKLLNRSYFFIYLFHYIPLALMMRVLRKVVEPTTNVEYFAIYFGCFIAIVMLSVGLFWVLQKIAPKITAFMLGNRV